MYNIYVQIKRRWKVQNMKNKLYEYEVTKQLNYQFIKRVSIVEETKTFWFELIAIDTITNNEIWLIKETKQLDFERVSWKIKDFLIGIIEVEITNLICDLNLDYQIEQLDNGFILNGKEFLLKDNKYAELRKKVLKAVKQYGLH